MKPYLPRVYGSVMVGVLILLLLLILPMSFTPFEHVSSEKSLLPLTEDVNTALSRVLWIDRQLDVMVLAVLLFITGVCCSTLLQFDRRETQ